MSSHYNGGYRATRIAVLTVLCLMSAQGYGQIVTKLNNVTNTVQDTTTTSTDGRMGLGSNGKGDDAHIYLANVLKDDDGTYKTWYGGHDGATLRTYYATSPDGLIWTKYTNSIPPDSNTNSTLGCIARGTGAGRGDMTHAYGAWVIKDGGVYKAWYSGQDAANLRIYYATSPDGLTWTKYQNATPTNSNSNSTEGRIPLGTNSGDSVHAFYPSVIKDGATYRMWYSGYGTDAKWRIYYASSTNGLDWVKLDNSILAASNVGGSNGRIPLGTSGGDNTQVFAPGVVKTATGYRMWYTGYDGAKYRIYHATSSNGLDWAKVSNAVPGDTNTTTTAGRIAAGMAGRGDTSGIYRAVPLLDTGMPYRLWYMGSDAANWRTYYATMERDRPAVTNLATINVGLTTADLSGALLQNESDPARLYVFWGLTNGGTNTASWATNADWGVMSPGSFTNTITGLTGSSTYYYRFYATNALGEGWASNSTAFATLGGPLIAMTNGATSITGACATISGLILGGKPDPTVYVCWGSANGGQSTTGAWQYVQALGSKSNAFALTVTNLLIASQTNYYTFFATNQYGGAWAGVSNFVSDQTTILVSNNVTWERAQPNEYRTTEQADVKGKT